MLAYQRGDSLAFEVLYMRHKDALFAFLYRSCAQPAVIEELAHDAWTAIIRSVDSYQPSAKFKTYLYQVAHNKLVDYWRSNKNQQYSVDIAETEIAHTQDDLESHSERQQLQQSLTDAIAQLPSEQRDTFLLREEGFSQEEIANIVGVGRETVKSRLRYATQQLRETLQLQQRIPDSVTPESAAGASNE